MIILLANLLVNLFNFDFDVAKKWARRIFVGIVALIVLIIVVFVFRACNKRTVKFDEKEILEAQTAIANQDRQKQIEILAKSDAKEAVAEEIIANADAIKINTIHESKKKWSEATDAEIQAELERRAKQ